MDVSTATGPLVGLKVVEVGGIGPGPFAGTLLSDMGATFLRIDRPSSDPVDPSFVDGRGRVRLQLDLKQPESIAKVLKILTTADVLFEGFRPGVMERLGLGPAEVLGSSPVIVYGRVTGWGQQGPYSQMAGHDINYLAISGALHSIGTAEKPVPPLNLVADYGGGGMFLVAGILAALVHARRTGEGQVVDVVMFDGAAYLMNLPYGLLSTGMWVDQRGGNLVDGGAPFYDTYQCADGEWIPIAPHELRFYKQFVDKVGLDEGLLERHSDRGDWPGDKEVVRTALAKKTRAEWCELLEGTDTCFAPVLTMTEAPKHPHNLARGTFVEIDGVMQASPAPRFSRTPGRIQPTTNVTPNEAEVLWSECGTL